MEITFQYFYACFPGKFTNVAHAGEPIEGGGKFSTCLTAAQVLKTVA